MYEVSMIDGHIDEPKMTDNEIIRAVGLCNGIESGRCEECSYRNTKDGDCVEILAEDTIDLINRQKAENEKLLKVIFKKEELAQTLHKEHQKTVDELQFAKAEIERLKAEIKFSDYLEYETINQIKTEAYKEFADDFKQNIKDHRLEMNLNGLKGTHRTDEMTYQTIMDYIDNLLEEKAGNDHA